MAGLTKITGSQGTLTDFTSTGIDDNADATAITIDSSERVGIGETTPSDGLLVIKGDSDDNTTPSIRLKDGTDTREAWITNTAGDLYLTTGGDDNTPHTQLRMLNGNLMTFRTDNTEAMRINSNGAVGIGSTINTHKLYVEGGGNGVHIKQTSAGGYNLECNAQDNSGTYYFVNFLKNGAGISNITSNGSTISYNTGSDHRLKENVNYDFDATTRLKQLKPARFNFIEYPDRTVDGFVAHEVSSIVPEAITGEKDAVDENGNPIYQGIDQSKLVPVLTKALQEAITKIEELETRIQTLENN